MKFEAEIFTVLFSNIIEHMVIFSDQSDAFRRIFRKVTVANHYSPEPVFTVAPEFFLYFYLHFTIVKGRIILPFMSFSLLE